MFQQANCARCQSWGRA